MLDYQKEIENAKKTQSQLVRMFSTEFNRLNGIISKLPEEEKEKYKPLLEKIKEAETLDDWNAINKLLFEMMPNA